MLKNPVLFSGTIIVGLSIHINIKKKQSGKSGRKKNARKIIRKTRKIEKFKITAVPGTWYVIVYYTKSEKLFAYSSIDTCTQQEVVIAATNTHCS